MKGYILLILGLLLCSFVIADDYTKTGTQDFSLWLDSKPYLDGKMYATVDIPDYASSYAGETFNCVSLIFTNESGEYIHVQSNPELSQPGILSRTDGKSPEELGYFPVTNGLGNVYFRKFNQVSGINFLYVVKCNSNSTSLVWEGAILPGYREAGKTLPGRMTWLTSGANGYWVAGIFVFIFGITIMALIVRRVGRK
jgi:hypothetical protein